MATSDYIAETKGTITHSMLQAFMECEQYFYHLYITGNIRDEQTDEMLFGSAFDSYMTDRVKWSDTYEVVKRRTGSSNKIELTEKQGALIPLCLKEFQNQPLYSFDPKKSGNLNNDRITIEYKGEILSYKPDQLDLEKAHLSDIKTSGSLDNVSKFLAKYKMQLTFGQFVIQLKHDILVDGSLQIVTREEVPRSKFMFATKESLLDNRSILIEKLDAMILAKQSGIYQCCGNRETCPAYGFSSCTIQKEYIYF